MSRKITHVIVVVGWICIFCRMSYQYGQRNEHRWVDRWYAQNYPPPFYTFKAQEKRVRALYLSPGKFTSSDLKEVFDKCEVRMLQGAGPDKTILDYGGEPNISPAPAKGGKP